MEDKAVCNQVVVFDGLPLLVAAVLRDDAFAAEEGPLEEAVEGFALVGGSLDGRSQLCVGDVAEEEAGADYSSKLAEGLVEAILAAVGAQPAQDRRGADAASFYGENDAQHVGQMRLDKVPVNILREERVDMFIAHLRVGTAKVETLPVANAGHQLNA